MFRPHSLFVLTRIRGNNNTGVRPLIGRTSYRDLAMLTFRGSFRGISEQNTHAQRKMHEEICTPRKSLEVLNCSGRRTLQVDFADRGPPLDRGAKNAKLSFPSSSPSGLFPSPQTPLPFSILHPKQSRHYLLALLPA
jgi:hypothetical protein